MSSYRYGGLGNGRGVFESTTLPSCASVSTNYRAALIASRIDRQEASALVPSCEMLARGIAALTGKPAPWASCTGYPGHFDPAHMQGCLTPFLPLYYGDNRTLQSLNGCEDATRQYEIALRSATQGNNKAYFSQDLPLTYEKPDCEKVAAMIGGKGSACLAYQPGLPHLQQCLGTEAGDFIDCVPLRQRYEQKLREAYGGGLPQTYTILACDQLAALTDAAKARQAELRAEASRRRRAQIAARQQHAPSPFTWPGTQSALSTLLFHWLGAAFFFALLCHGALSAWGLLYAHRQLTSGAWAVVGDLLAAGVYERIFRWKLMAAHGLLLLAGWWLTHWSWIVGALGVMALSRLALIILIAIGVFKGPRRRPGPVNVQGTVIYPDSRGHRDEVDHGVSDDWGANVNSGEDEARRGRGPAASVSPNPSAGTGRKSGQIVKER